MIPVDDCTFCKKDVIEKSFFSGSKYSALYNAAPILPGHSLIIPNRHYGSLFELSDDELGEMMVFARKVTAVLKSFFNCDGFDWTVQDGKSAGQTVPHIHLHIIPRKAHDLSEGEEWYSKIRQNEKQIPDSSERERLSGDEYDAITEKLAEAAKSILK